MKAFLHVFDLHVGVQISSVVGFTLMLITTFVNFYAYVYGENQEEASVQAIQYCLLGIYLVVMYAGFICAFFGAFWENSKSLRVAAGLVIAGLLIYFTLASFSIAPDYSIMRKVCPGQRCPDHHWLHRDRWRSLILPVNEEFQTASFKPVGDGSEVVNDLEFPLEYDPAKRRGSKNSLYVIVSVFYILIYIAYLMSTVLTILSFVKELESELIV